MSVTWATDCDSAQCQTCKRVYDKDDFAFPYECLACADAALAEHLAEREYDGEWDL